MNEQNTERFIIFPVEESSGIYYEIHQLINNKYYPMHRNAAKLRFRLEKMAEMCVSELNKPFLI